MTRTSATVHAEAGLRVLDVRCASRPGQREEEEPDGVEVVVPLAGAFERRDRWGTEVIDAAFGFVARPGMAQAITHLTDGDRCIALLAADHVVEGLGLADHRRPTVLPLDRRAQRALAGALATAPDRLAAGEAWFAVLETASAAGSASAAEPGNRRAARVRRTAADRVRQAIHDDPGAAWTVAALAAIAGYAPHHLSRTFRATTGWSLSEYRDRVRLGVAMSMLRDGVPGAAVAASLGWCDQGHLARRARDVLGVVPSALRPHAS